MRGTFDSIEEEYLAYLLQLLPLSNIARSPANVWLVRTINEWEIAYLIPLEKLAVRVQ